MYGGLKKIRSNEDLAVAGGELGFLDDMEFDHYCPSHRPILTSSIYKCLSSKFSAVGWNTLSSQSTLSHQERFEIGSDSNSISKEGESTERRMVAVLELGKATR